MKFDPQKHHRRSIRLKGYDYSAPGAYFVTIVAQGRTCLFGEVVDGDVRSTLLGEVVENCWREIPGHFPTVELGAFVVMPNHVHGIIILHDDDRRGGVTPPLRGPEYTPVPGDGTSIPGDETSPLHNDGENLSIRRPTLGHVVAYFKYQSTKRINAFQGSAGNPVWQRNYYERVVRNERELDAIREYILANPQYWADDEENVGLIHE